MVTLKLFECLLETPLESTIYQLSLANIISRYYFINSIDYLENWSDEEDARIRGSDYGKVANFNCKCLYTNFRLISLSFVEHYGGSGIKRVIGG